MEFFRATTIDYMATIFPVEVSAFDVEDMYTLLGKQNLKVTRELQVVSYEKNFPVFQYYKEKLVTKFFQVLETIAQWVQHDNQTRSSQLGVLLPVVRFSLISSGEMASFSVSYSDILKKMVFYLSLSRLSKHCGYFSCLTK